MLLFSFNIFTDISFCCEAFLELRFWISGKKILSFFIFKGEFMENLLCLLIQTKLGCLKNFSMHAKTGLS